MAGVCRAAPSQPVDERPRGRARHPAGDGAPAAPGGPEWDLSFRAPASSLGAASSPRAPARAPHIAHGKHNGAGAKGAPRYRWGGTPACGMCSPVGLSPCGTPWASPLSCFAKAGVPSMPGHRRCPGWCRCCRRGALCAPEWSPCPQTGLGLKASAVRGARGPAGLAAPLHPPGHGGTKAPLSVCPAKVPIARAPRGGGGGCWHPMGTLRVPVPTWNSPSQGAPTPIAMQILTFPVKQAASPLLPYFHLTPLLARPIPPIQDWGQGQAALLLTHSPQSFPSSCFVVGSPAGAARLQGPPPPRAWHMWASLDAPHQGSHPTLGYPAPLTPRMGTGQGGGHKAPGPGGARRTHGCPSGGCTCSSTRWAMVLAPSASSAALIGRMRRATCEILGMSVGWRGWGQGHGDTDLHASHRGRVRQLRRCSVDAAPGTPPCQAL